MAPFVEFFGRFHVLLLHAPIGLLFGLLALEALSLLRRRPLPREFRSPFAWLVALAAVATAATGFVLGRSGEFDGDLVDTHRILGIASAVICVAAAAIQQWAGKQGGEGSSKGGATGPYYAALAIATGAIVVAGHKGGAITHGPNFLLGPFDTGASGKQGKTAEKLPPVDANSDAAANAAPSSEDPQFVRVVRPILEKRCYACHGPDKKKGGLALHTPDAISRGGDFGPIITPGHPEVSEIIRRLKLDTDDDDHMPPEGKPQLTSAEVKALEDWIASGARMDAAPAPAKPSETDASGATDAVTHAAPVAAPAPAALAALRARLVHVAPISQGSPLLAVDLSVAADMSETDAIALLAPLRSNIVELTASRLRVGDRLAELIAGMPGLRKLDLSGTDLTDAGVRALAALPAIEDLVLTRAQLSDAAAGAISGIPTLKRVYLWKSGVSPEAAQALRSSRPGLVVDLGLASASEPLEREAEVKFTSEAPAGAVAAPVADALKPVNALCPVSGKPIDPGFLLVHKGRVVGFCCKVCLGQFLEDPAKFEGKIQ